VAGRRIDRGQAIGSAQRQQLFVLRCWVEQARCREGGRVRTARNSPALVSAERVVREDRAFYFIVVGDDNEAVDNDRRLAESVVFSKAADVFPPDFVSTVGKRYKKNTVAIKPHDVHVVFIDRRRARGEAVKAVLTVRTGVETLLPKGIAGEQVVRQDDLLARVRVGRHREQPVVPGHRRAMTNAGQRHAPQIVFLFPFGGNVLGVALAGAVGATEAVPILRVGGIECAKCEERKY
jgi:hypothetical protein